MTMKSSPSTEKAKAREAALQVRKYLAAQPVATRRRLKQIRDIIRGVAPGAAEAFSYRIPGFKVEGRPFIWYAGFRHHTSLFPMGDAIRRAHAAQLKGYKTSKGTIQFPLDEPLPTALVKRLVKARMAEMRTGE
jgi:uncharacterized protein YdhG (YjbR/CyaY superfamily)